MLVAILYAVFSFFPVAQMDPCTHDPGHHPGWENWKAEPFITYWSCTDGYHIDTHGDCFLLHYADYYDMIDRIDLKYRLEVCACWDTWPNDQTARDACIAEATNNISNERYLYYLNWIHEVQPACCEADQ